ncbi:hypothetical protein Bhyg_02565 [Pseudolycoriella hygida]|uniref:Uncharacterized protein n=1 Tax=Pseudolycoriella hygida TaxID=35572 RepID=A0A9Q0NBM9_9DIPT|nr:hypothetical protein Bhyg_02565 [Pseudolycoriella hygida]
MKLIGLAFVFFFGSSSTETLNGWHGGDVRIKIDDDQIVRLNNDEESMNLVYCPCPPTTSRPLYCSDFCGNFVGWKNDCSQFDIGMQFSSVGQIPGKYCVQMTEPADPHTWSDNFICFNKDYGVRWSHGGEISRMKCAQIVETSDPHTWSDNFLCLPQGSPFRFHWSITERPSGLCCVHIHEPAEPREHGWYDNYLCVSEYNK